MALLTNETTLTLWQEVVRFAEKRRAIMLEPPVENYLTSLLIRYTNRPELAQHLFATAFLEAQPLHAQQRATALQDVGDQCLLYAGLFPHAAQKKHVKITYFIDLGRGAYAAIKAHNDLYRVLAVKFVDLMDVLQSIPECSDLSPFEAYEQWHTTGSQHALELLQLYARAGILPFKC